MARPAAFLLAHHGPRHWTIARLAGRDVHCYEIRDTADPAAAGTVTADRLAESMRQLGYRGQGVVLGLPAATSYFATVHCADLGRKDRRTALLYRLEEQLPVEAERLTADFVPPVAGNCLGVAVETAAVGLLIQELQDHGIEVAAVCPTSLLALWQAGRTRSQPDYVLVPDGTRLCVFRMAGRQPVAAYATDPQVAPLVRILNVDLLNNPPAGSSPRCVAIAPVDDALLAAVEEEAGLSAETPVAGTAFDLAARAAAKALAGEMAGWIDLRRDQLAPPRAWGRLAGPVRAAMVLFLTLLVVIAAGSYWRSYTYRRQIDLTRRQQQAEYRAVYRDGPVPVDVKSRLKSELTRLTGISGGDESPPSYPAALDSLRRIVASMPPALRWRLTDIRIEPGGILIEGQARQHADAELIAQSLKRKGGFVTEAPKTESLAKGGVSFTINGRYAAGTPATAKDTP